MILKKKRILITGGYGFLGSSLYSSLKNKNKVFRFGKFSKKKIISATILKKIKKNFDIIIHCAGSSSVAKSIEDPAKDYQKTVGSTKALINFIKMEKKKIKLIYISSPAVFGNSIKKKLLKPISPYGKNKLKSEQLLIKLSKEMNIEIAIIRFFSLYGEGLKKQLLWDILSKLKKKAFSFYGDGSETRSWMHISDATRVVNLVLKNNIRGVKFINAPGNNVLTNKQIINNIYKKCNVKEKPFFTGIIKKGDPKKQIFSNDDLKSIGWKQTVDISVGLKKYIKWFKKQ
jgi:UDP-glucose 4-epimerase